MRASEIREMDADELSGQMDQLRKRLFELRTEFHTDEEPDTSEKSKIKKDIARILTVLREREIEALKSQKGSELAESEA